MMYLANHLWQSTVFSILVGLLALALKNYPARVRYTLWLAASVKFLLPFAVLTDLGNRFARPVAISYTPPAMSSIVRQVSAPFTARNPLATIPAVAAASINWIPLVFFSVWAIGFLAIICFRLRSWRQIRATVLTSESVDLLLGIEVRTSEAFSEPGVFGIRRPILLLPARIDDYLTPPQLDSILAHELCHLRRRDNLTAAIHMAVEALFWFYPLVWWLGSRLMEERERACDEEVTRGSEPGVYAEGILRVCERYTESSLACVAGVTGGNLKKRIEAVMSHRTASSLNFAKKAALLAAATATLITPFLIGVMNAPVVHAQEPRLRFEAASVKMVPENVGDRRQGYWVAPHLENPLRMRALEHTVKLIEFAYHLRDFQIANAPAWVKDIYARYEIVATAPKPSTEEEMRRMTRTLLEDRFQLKVHREIREMSVYALIVGKNGPKLTEAENPNLNRGQGNFDIGKGLFRGRGGLMSVFTDILTENSDKPVIDKTGLTGHYDFDLYYDPSSLPDWRMGPALFGMVQDMGLKLEQQKTQVEILVIDFIARPSEN